MGQYYMPLICRDNEYVSYDLGDDAKLTEHSFIGGAPDSIAWALYKAPAELAWVGDYADENEWERNLKNHAFGVDAKTLSLPDKLNVTDKYIVNHTKHEYIDMKAYIEKVADDKWGYMHPLSLMTAVGNGRGGGDYFSPVNKEEIGRWASDVISVEDEPPQNFKAIDVWFSETPKMIERWESLNRDITFIIKDYLFDNDNGYKSEVDSDYELFKNVDTSSPESIMKSLLRLELAENSDVLGIINDAGVNIDWSANWVNIYARCDEGSFDEMVVVLENKENGNVEEIPIAFTSKQASELEAAAKSELWADAEDINNEKAYINNIVEAAKEITDVGADSLVLTDYGNFRVTIKIFKDLDWNHDPDNPLQTYDVYVNAPSPKGKILSEYKRRLGCVINITEEELKNALYLAIDGSYEISGDKEINAVGREITIKEAVEAFNAKHKAKDIER